MTYVKQHPEEAARSLPVTVSVIIPAKDEGEKIGACLTALRQQSVGWSSLDILVVDDGSSDGTWQLAAEHGARVVRQAHRGAASARNRGIREATGEILVFVDADCMPRPDFIERLIEPLVPARKPYEVVGAVGVYKTTQSGSLACLIQTELDVAYEKLARASRVDFANTGAVAYRRDALEDPHGFREDFGKLEDIELSYRVTRNGAKITFVPTAVVNHLHAENWAVFLRTKFYYGYYSVPLFASFPKKLAADSRTSNERKMQVILAFMTVCTALTIPFWGWGILLFFIFLMSFIGSTFRFSRRAWSRSRIAALFAPAYLFGNTLSFAAGFLVGSARWALKGKSAKQQG